MRSSWQIARCSRVWGITPSSAAITSMTRSIPPTPASMFFTNRSWPGTSTMPRVMPSPELEMGEADVDGDAPLLLLLEAVGVDPGERQDQAGLAVIDVARGADDDVAHGSRQTRRAPRRRRRASGTSSSMTVRQSSRSRSPAMRPITGGRPRAERASSAAADAPACPRASAAVASSARGSAPPPTSERLGHDGQPERRARRRRARRASTRPRAAADDGAGLAQHAERRDLARGRRRVLVGAQRRLEGRQRQLVDPERPVERVLPQPLHERAAGRRRCRPAGRRAACRRRT